MSDDQTNDMLERILLAGNPYEREKKGTRKNRLPPIPYRIDTCSFCGDERGCAIIHNKALCDRCLEYCRKLARRISREHGLLREKNHLVLNDRLNTRITRLFVTTRNFAIQSGIKESLLSDILHSKVLLTKEEMTGFSLWLRCHVYDIFDQVTYDNAPMRKRRKKPRINTPSDTQ